MLMCHQIALYLAFLTYLNGLVLPSHVASISRAAPRRDRERVDARDRQRAADEAAAAAAIKADVLRVLLAQTAERRAQRDDERRRMREAAAEARQSAKQAEVCTQETNSDQKRSTNCTTQ
jgi:hypothetical protein